jgi:hypothetical protein
MRKVIKTIALFSLPLFVSCGGGSSKSEVVPEIVNEAPSTVSLTYPTEDLLCIDNSITFDWSDATDANNDGISYKVEISTDRSISSVVKTETVSSSQATIVLEKGVAHYWRVTAIDSKGKSGEPSSVFAFYTRGVGVVNNAPFTAELVSPANESELTTTTVSVDLKWKGADSDNASNTLKYDLYFGDTTDPAKIESNLEILTKNVMVGTGKTYYWKVNTIDPSGTKSVGQVWSFKVN